MTHREQGSIATTRATCDARAESRRVHWAWRGRDSPAPPEHDGELGSFLFSSVEGRHRALPRGYHHGTFRRVAFLSCVLFLRHVLGSCGGRRLVLCDVAERPMGMSPDVASERRQRWEASILSTPRPYSQAQVPDRRISAHITAISTSGHPRTPAHSHRTTT